jgi:diguanylate cyclase (GGDEF)-like protein
MPHRQPELTFTSRLLLKAAGATERWTPPTQWTVAFVSLLAVCALDMVSGARVMPLFFYLLVAGLAAWSFGERKGALFGLLVSMSGVTVRHFQVAADPHLAIVPMTEIWNLIARVLTTSLVVVLVSGMRSAVRLERWRASTDGLTGVLNKSAFQERMTTAVAAARGTQRAFILCYMDIDGFKQVNDRHGHSAGDEILRLFASAAVDAIRDGDLFARIGGDEFVALINIPAIGQGDHVATLVHRRISDILAKTGLPVSCSMGALLATAGELQPIEAAVQLADSLMYEVKRSGKSALRVGRIDPAKGLIAPDFLRIESDSAGLTSFGNRSCVMAPDRRAA